MEICPLNAVLSQLLKWELHESRTSNQRPVITKAEKLEQINDYAEQVKEEREGERGKIKELKVQHTQFCFHATTFSVLSPS